MMTEDNVKTKSVTLNNNFYRDAYKKIVAAVILCAIIIAALCFVILRQWTDTPPPKYFRATKLERIVPNIPLYRPNQTDRFVLQWGSSVVMRAFALNFTNIKFILTDVVNKFDHLGWVSYLNNIQYLYNFNYIRQHKVSLSVWPIKAPVILEKGVINGRYAWKMKMTIQVTMHAADKSVRYSHFNVVMIITRALISKKQPSAIEIAQFIAVPENAY